MSDVIPNDGRYIVVRTGQPEVLLVACAECGVLLWDIDAHYKHAHFVPPHPPRGVSH